MLTPEIRVGGEQAFRAMPEDGELRLRREWNGWTETWSIHWRFLRLWISTLAEIRPADTTPARAQAIGSAVSCLRVHRASGSLEDRLGDRRFVRRVLEGGVRELSMWAGRHCLAYARVEGAKVVELWSPPGGVDFLPCGTLSPPTAFSDPRDMWRQVLLLREHAAIHASEED